MARGLAILPLVADEKMPKRSIAPSEVTVITVTIKAVPAVRRRPLRERVAGIRMLYGVRTFLAVALALAIPAAIIAVGQQSSRTSRPARARRAQAPDAESAAIAAALGYPYPLRCLTITISVSNPDYARADVDRADGCGRYHGYVNASVHRDDGTWRVVLDEGQLYVPNSLLTTCSGGRAGCAGADRTAGAKGSHSSTAGSVGVGATSGHPLGCFSLAIALHDPRFARADFDRTVCQRVRAR